MSLELGLGQGVHGWGRGGVQELDLKEDLALTCRLFPLPSDTTHQQRGVPGLQCEPGAGTSLRMELGVGSTASGSGPEPTVCPPHPRLPQSGCSGRESSCIDISWPPARTSSETESTTSGSIGEWRPCLPPGPTPLFFSSFSFCPRHLGLALLLAELGLGLGRCRLSGESLPLSSPLLPFDSLSFSLSP